MVINFMNENKKEVRTFRVINEFLNVYYQLINFPGYQKMNYTYEQNLY